MATVFDAIDKAPFSGKFAIRDSVVSYQQSGPSQEKSRYARTMGLLGYMVAGHALQAKIGLDAAKTHIGQVMQDGHISDFLAAGCDISYATVNALVTLRQANLLQRTHQTHKRRRQQYSTLTDTERNTLDNQSTKREAISCPPSRKAVMGACAFTLSMQALFGASYYQAREAETHLACMAEASAFYDDWSLRHPGGGPESKIAYVRRTCPTG